MLANNTSVLPDTPSLRRELAEMIAKICNCEAAPLLEDQEFSLVIAHFDSLSVLEIMIEIDRLYGIETEEMLPEDQGAGGQEMLSTFPRNLTELTDFLAHVVALRPEREAARQARIQKSQAHLVEQKPVNHKRPET
jgi:acyl carrier protein